MLVSRFHCHDRDARNLAWLELSIGMATLLACSRLLLGRRIILRCEIGEKLDAGEGLDSLFLDSLFDTLDDT